MSLESTLTPANGFHSSYTTTIALAKDTLRPDCSLNLLHDLPAHVFVDPYELAHYQDAYTFRLLGTTNLELPVTAVAPSGSILLLNITLPSRTAPGDLTVAVQVPIHLRYGEPVEGGASGYYTEQVLLPLGFVACPTSRWCSHLALICHN
jgi:phosphatidylinositol glycan class X